MQVKINSSWSEVLKEEFEKVYFQEIRDQLKLLKNQGKVIYPSGSLIFNAFNLTPFDQVKVVIIGQDPYHGEGEAMGLCFSVPKGIKIPQIRHTIDISELLPLLFEILSILWAVTYIQYIE